MHSSALIAFVCSFLMLGSSVAHPLQTDSHPEHGHQGHSGANNGGSVARSHSHPHAQAVVQGQPGPRNNGPGPRFLSRRWEGSLPSGSSPSDTDDDTAKALHHVQISKIPKVKRHDHILSPNVTDSGSCNVGEKQCCQSIHQTQDKKPQLLSSILGIVLPADNSMVGIQCTPVANLIPIVGGGSSTCQSEPVCCTGNEYGLLAHGCSPISL